MQPTPEPEKKVKKKRRRISPFWSLGYLAVLATLYTFRFDQTYVLTVWPSWVWMMAGLVLVLVARHRKIWLLIAHCLFAFFFVDEARSYPRSLMPEPLYDIRIVSLNCAGGSTPAAREVLALKPDIVLLQESPEKTAMEEIAKELFGDKGVVIPGPDASIIAKGPLTPVVAKYANDYVGGVWTDKRGRSLNLIALRLTPPTMRIDIYNPDAWREFAENRKARREEVEDIAKELQFDPDIVGGDFNTPPDIGVLSPLVGRLKDSFAETGVGYGATCVHPYPCLVRIDQIWHSSNMESTRTWVVKTENSDHRMLVAEYRWTHQ